MPDPFTLLAVSILQSMDPSAGPDSAALADAIKLEAETDVRDGTWTGLGVVPFASAHGLEALLAVTASEESHFAMGAAGDSGKSHCAMQIMVPAAQVATPALCVHAAVINIRESARIARALGVGNHPLGQYCGGALVPKAQRISDHRLKRAAWLVHEVETFIHDHADDWAYMTGECGTLALCVPPEPPRACSEAP